MSPATIAEIPASPADCWNRIGVRGDRSCPELIQHSHCRNCSVHAQAARRLFERPLASGVSQRWEESYAIPIEPRDAGTRSLTLFRAGAEKFAIATTRCVEAVNMRMIHRIPHQRESVLGLTNIHGELILCVSFAMLLNLDTPQGPPMGDRGKLLVTDWSDGPIALAVDETIGVCKFRLEELKPPPASLVRSPSRCCMAMIEQEGGFIGVLDDALLEQTLKRQLA